MRSISSDNLSSSFGEFDPEDQMAVSVCTCTCVSFMYVHCVFEKGEKLTSVDFLARLRSVGSFLITYERETFCSAGVSVFGEEDSCDASEPLEDFAEVLLFCEFRDLLRTC